MTAPVTQAGCVSAGGITAATWNLACAFPAGRLHSVTQWPATGALIWWASCSVASPATARCATDAKFGRVYASSQASYVLDCRFCAPRFTHPGGVAIPLAGGLIAPAHDSQSAGSEMDPAGGLVFCRSDRFADPLLAVEDRKS